MIWIIASLPFWIIGIGAMSAALSGVRREVVNHRTDSATWPAFLLLMLIAALALYIAAKIAS